MASGKLGALTDAGERMLDIAVQNTDRLVRLIGDILDDVEAGRRAGCRTILLDNGNETEWRTGEARCPDYVVRDLAQAAAIVAGAA